MQNKKPAIGVNFDGIEINGVKYKDWDEQTKKDFWEGFESNTLGNPNKYPYHSSSSSSHSSTNSHWTDKFNMGDPNKDEGHWVTLKNHKHIFIKDEKGSSKTTPQSGSNASKNSSFKVSKSKNSSIKENIIAQNINEFLNTANKTVKTKEKTYEQLGKAVSPSFLLAGANLQNALYDFKYAKDNKHAHILNSRSEVKNKDINKALDSIKVPQGSRGVYYDISSDESKALFKTYTIQKLIKENKEKWKNNKTFHVEQVEFRKIEFDAYLALQNCKLVNPKITDDGRFEAMVIDYYDFLYRKDAKNALELLLNDVNNWGLLKQEKGELEKYFVIYSIREKI